MYRHLWWMAALLSVGCVELDGRTPTRDGGVDGSDARPDATPDAPDGAPLPLPQDVAPIPGCALAPSARPGQELTARANPLMSALTYSFHVKSMVVDSRGGVVVFGGATSCGRPDNFDAAAIRFGPDGELDASFGVGGRFCLNTTLEGENQDETLLAAAVDGDGRLVFVGLAESRRTMTRRGLVVRTSSDGTLDPSFYGLGWRHIYEAQSPIQSANIALWSVLIDGTRIVAAGSDASPFNLPSLGVVVALDASGDLDRTFNRRGVYFDNARFFYGVARRTDGYIVSGTERATPRVSLRALGLDGSPISSFGDRGLAVHALPQDAFAGDLLVGDDGGVFVVRALITAVGSYQSAPAEVVHFLPNGDTDLTFGTQGFYATGGLWYYSYSHGHHLARHCDGRVVFTTQAAGTSPPIQVHRFTPEGRADVTFGSGGVATLRGGARSTVSIFPVGIAVAPETAEVFVAGGNTNNSTVEVRVAAP